LPIFVCGCRTADVKIANIAGRSLLSAVTHDANLITLNRSSRAPIAHRAGTLFEVVRP
jgi:hypothetical protein